MNHTPARPRPDPEPIRDPKDLKAWNGAGPREACHAAAGMSDPARAAELGPEEFGSELTRAVVRASRLGLSRRGDVAIAYLAYLQQRTFPPDLLVLTRGEVERILDDEERDVHDIAPAEWASTELILPYGELGYDQWDLAERVRETGREALAIGAVRRAATELAAELPDVVVLAFDYEGEDEQLAEGLDRVLAPDAPLRALL